MRIVERQSECMAEGSKKALWYAYKGQVAKEWRNHLAYFLQIEDEEDTHFPQSKAWGANYILTLRAVKGG